MTDKRLTDLAAVTDVADTDLLYVVDDVAGTPGSKKITGANLKAAAVKDAAGDRTVSDGTSGGVNIVAGASVNENTGTTANTVSGGGTTGNPNRLVTGIVNTIAGGYNNVIDQTGTGATTISGGAHHHVTGASDHGTIAGGSHCTIDGATYAAIGGGTNNTVTANYGTIPGGSGHTVSAQLAGVTHGATCTASQTYALAGGQNAVASGGPFSLALGRDVTASGVGASAIGRDNVAVGNYSMALGDGSRTTSVGQVAQSSGFFATAGDAQASVQVMKRETLDAATQTMALAFNPQQSSAFAYKVTLVAREDATGDSKAWTLEGLARRNATTTVTLVGGSPTPTVLGADAGASAWAVSLLAGTGTFNVRVTGEADKTIRWVARVELTEVVG